MSKFRGRLSISHGVIWGRCDHPTTQSRCKPIGSPSGGLASSSKLSLESQSVHVANAQITFHELFNPLKPQPCLVALRADHLHLTSNLQSVRQRTGGGGDAAVSAHISICKAFCFLPYHRHINGYPRGNAAWQSYKH